jgi:hypothetical protein
MGEISGELFRSSFERDAVIQRFIQALHALPAR